MVFSHLAQASGEEARIESLTKVEAARLQIESSYLRENAISDKKMWDLMIHLLRAADEKDGFVSRSAMFALAELTEKYQLEKFNEATKKQLSRTFNNCSYFSDCLDYYSKLLKLSPTYPREILSILNSDKLQGDAIQNKVLIYQRENVRALATFYASSNLNSFNGRTPHLSLDNRKLVNKVFDESKFRAEEVFATETWEISQAITGKSLAFAFLQNPEDILKEDIQTLLGQQLQQIRSILDEHELARQEVSLYLNRLNQTDIKNFLIFLKDHAAQPNSLNGQLPKNVVLSLVIRFYKDIESYLPHRDLWIEFMRDLAPHFNSTDRQLIFDANQELNAIRKIRIATMEGILESFEAKDQKFIVGILDNEIKLSQKHKLFHSAYYQITKLVEELKTLKAASLDSQNVGTFEFSKQRSRSKTVIEAQHFSLAQWLVMACYATSLENHSIKNVELAFIGNLKAPLSQVCSPTLSFNENQVFEFIRGKVQWAIIGPEAIDLVIQVASIAIVVKVAKITHASSKILFKVLSTSAAKAFVPRALSSGFLLTTMKAYTEAWIFDRYFALSYSVLNGDRRYFYDKERSWNSYFRHFAFMGAFFKMLPGMQRTSIKYGTKVAGIAKNVSPTVWQQTKLTGTQMALEVPAFTTFGLFQMKIEQLVRGSKDPVLTGMQDLSSSTGHLVATLLAFRVGQTMAVASLPGAI